MIIPNIWENRKWQPNHQPAYLDGFLKEIALFQETRWFRPTPWIPHPADPSPPCDARIHDLATSCRGTAEESVKEMKASTSCTCLDRFNAWNLSIYVHMYIYIYNCIYIYTIVYIYNGIYVYIYICNYIYSTYCICKHTIIYITINK